MIDDTLVIIRSVGERTTSLCKELLLQQISKDNIKIIKNITPFSKAVNETFRLGILSQKKWVITVDADILLFPNTLEKMIAKAESLPDNLYFYDGNVLDKFLFQPRGGGPHLYRTSLLQEAIKIPTKNSLRAETFILKQMIQKGYLFIRSEEIYGLHDFEQANFDIYRTCFLHARKHERRRLSLISHFLEYSKSDQDYIIALRGLIDGIFYRGKVINSPSFFRPFFSLFQKSYLLKPKPVLNLDPVKNHYFFDRIQKDFERINNKKVDPLFEKYSLLRYLYYLKGTLLFQPKYFTDISLMKTLLLTKKTQV